ncbi:MAG: ribonuclease III [Bacillota bacterium]|jgi:ribonuclease-3|nr:ribonuclease III [Candidatus Fermentithermobacillaceae bacterium]
MKAILERALLSLSPACREEALTHVSYANEKGSPINNERLEFLGDAVLYLAVGSILYGRYPSSSEGDLTRMRASLVSGANLARIALEGGLGDLIRLGKGEQASGGHSRPRVLGSALEALIGGVFVEHGWRRALSLVKEIYAGTTFDSVPVDPKTRVQELVQRTPGGTLDYRVVKVEGPDHRRLFTVACVVNGEEVSTGEGSSKKEAEERAAAAYLRVVRET